MRFYYASRYFSKSLFKTVFGCFFKGLVLMKDQNYLYEKNSSDKLLCKHYLYEIRSHKDPEALNTLKSVYGDDVSDGIISCKVCKCYICHEDFSLLEGFGDGVPTSTREVLDVEKDEIHNLTIVTYKLRKDSKNYLYFWSPIQ